jgi:hypothetical protein
VADNWRGAEPGVRRGILSSFDAVEYFAQGLGAIPEV